MGNYSSVSERKLPGSPLCGRSMDHTIVVSAMKLHLHGHADALGTSLKEFRQIPPIMEDNQHFFRCGTTSIAQEILDTCMMEGPVSPCLGSIGSQFSATGILIQTRALPIFSQHFYIAYPLSPLGYFPEHLSGSNCLLYEIPLT